MGGGGEVGGPRRSRSASTTESILSISSARCERAYQRAWVLHPSASSSTFSSVSMRSTSSSISLILRSCSRARVRARSAWTATAPRLGSTAALTPHRRRHQADPLAPSAPGSACSWRLWKCCACAPEHVWGHAGSNRWFATHLRSPYTGLLTRSLPGQVNARLIAIDATDVAPECIATSSGLAR
jgi:hypothetical protein